MAEETALTGEDNVMGVVGRKHNRENLTAMETRFIIEFEGRGFREQTKAAAAAGYKHPDVMAVKIRKRPAVKAEIAKRRKAALATITAKSIMDRDALLTLWSTVAQSSEKKDNDRLAASKLLAEFLGMFEKDNQDNVPRSLLQIVQCVEGRCPRCGEMVRVQPVEVLIEQPASGRKEVKGAR